MNRLVFLLLCFACISLPAQDTIFNKDGTQVIAKVLEIGELIKYRKTDNPDGPLYSVEKKEIRAIRYSNGVLEEIKSPELPLPPAYSYMPPDSLRKRKKRPRQEKLFCLYTNIAQALIGEFLLGAEVRINSYLSAGVAGGIITYDPLFDPLVLSPNQGDWPGTAYNGYSLRANFKVHPNKNKNGYWSLQGVYKSMSYRNHSFYDMYGEHEYANYTRSEDAYVLGLSIVHGHEFNVVKGWLYLDIFYGLGFRVRERSIYTLSSDPYPQEAPAPKVGYTHREQAYPMLDAGIKIGLSLPKKQKPPVN